MTNVCIYPECNCPIDKNGICVRGLPEPEEDRMSDGVWTPWIPNPGDGECPVPEWAEDYQLYIAGPGKESYSGGKPPESWDWFGSERYSDITHYRYAVPADLAWLARYVEEFLLGYTAVASSDYSGCPEDVKRFICRSRHQWLRARRDLGYESNTATPEEEEELQRQDAHRSDPVNHPSHYQSDNGIECIEAIQAALGNEAFVSHCRGNAIKYIWRCGDKGKPKEDLQKAAWYLNKAAKVMGND